MNLDDFEEAFKRVSENMGRPDQLVVHPGLHESIVQALHDEEVRRRALHIWALRHPRLTWLRSQGVQLRYRLIRLRNRVRGLWHHPLHEYWHDDWE